MPQDLSSPGAIAIGCIVGVISSAAQSLGLTLQRKSHLVETYHQSIASNGGNLTSSSGSSGRTPTGLGISGPACEWTSGGGTGGATTTTGGAPTNVPSGFNDPNCERLERSPSPTLVVPLHRRSMWQLGVFLFIASNILGSSVQISTLPLIVLSPLQAVGLVFNSICASILLDEPYTKLSMLGTILVTVGAVVIAAFGAIPEPNHNLAELLVLFARWPFIIWMICSLVGVVVIVALACSLSSLAPVCSSLGAVGGTGGTTSTTTIINNNNMDVDVDIEHDRQKRLSSSSLASSSNAPVEIIKSLEYDHNHDDSSVLPIVQKLSAEANTTKNQRVLGVSTNPTSHSSLGTNIRLHIDTNVATGYSSISSPVSGDALDDAGIEETQPLLGRGGSRSHHHRRGPYRYIDVLLFNARKMLHFCRDTVSSWSVSRRAPLIKGALFGVVSGILSAHSLLMAKAAVELIVKGFANRWKDYGQWESWMIVLAFGMFAVLQLYFLNCGLHILSTSVLYPLVFCVYNVTSIANSLIFFKQSARLSRTQLFCVQIGTLLVIAGVVCLSWRLQYHGAVAIVPESSSPTNFGYSPNSATLSTPYHQRLSDSYFTMESTTAPASALDIYSNHDGQGHRDGISRKSSQKFGPGGSETRTGIVPGSSGLGIGLVSGDGTLSVTSPSIALEADKTDEYTSFRSLAAHPPESTSPFSGKRAMFRRERAWSLEQREIISQLSEN